MSDLVLAAFAAETGGHVVDEPRERRFERFRRAFDEAAFRASLAARGLRFVGRSDGWVSRRCCASCTTLRRGCSYAARVRLSCSAQPAVAVVGARACSSYGSQVARLLGRELAAAGLVVVSGLARGIDGEAHRGALEAGGQTVAVLGCGIDRDYPAAHAQLAARIVRARAGRLRVRAGRRARALEVPGPQPDHRRARGRDGRGRGPRAQRRADHRRLRARSRPRGLRRARRDHVGALGGDERAPAPGRDAAHLAGGRARGARASTPFRAGAGARRDACPGARGARSRAEWNRRARSARRASTPRPWRRRWPSSSSPGPLPRPTVSTGGRGRRARIADIETSSYWLAEPRSPLAAPADRSAGPVDVAVVGGGVTGCACALRLAEAGKRVRLFEAREIAGGASGRNGGFALRGGRSRVRRRAEELGAERARAFWVLTERDLDRLEQLAGDAFRRDGQPPPGRGRGRARRARGRVRGAPRGRLRGRVARRAPEPLAGRFDGAHLPSAGWVASACTLGPAARRARRRGGRRAPRARARRVAGRARRRPGRDRDRRLHARPRARARRRDQADPRPGARDRAARAASVPVPALREARLRLLAADGGRPARGRRLPRQGRRPRVHRGGGHHAADPGSPGARSSPNCSARSRGSTTAGPGSSAPPPTGCRSSGAYPGANGVWVAAGYSGHGNVLGLACGELVAGAILGAAAPELELFDPARLLGG